MLRSSGNFSQHRPVSIGTVVGVAEYRCPCVITALTFGQFVWEKFGSETFERHTTCSPHVRRLPLGVRHDIPRPTGWRTRTLGAAQTLRASSFRQDSSRNTGLCIITSNRRGCFMSSFEHSPGFVFRSFSLVSASDVSVAHMKHSYLVCRLSRCAPMC